MFCWLFCSRTACEGLGPASLRGLVGSRRTVAVRDGAELSTDGRRRRLAVEQPVDCQPGRPASVDGYFPRSGHGEVAGQELVVDRLSGILAGSAGICKLLDHQPAGTWTAWRSALHPH